MPIKLLDLDFAKPVPSLYVDARYDAVAVCAFWHYVPLGVMEIWGEKRPFSLTPEQLQEKFNDQFSWQLWEHKVAGTLNWQTETREAALPPITVLVCTRDRATSLARCLAALQKLDYPTCEVVVVDNGSRDKRVAQVVAQYGFHCVREERPGLDWARNRGIAAASHDIVAFVDDDALAAPGWLRGIAHGFADPAVMAVTGLVLPAEQETSAQYDFELYGGMSKGFYPFTIQADMLSTTDLFWASGWGVGTNMAFRRALFAQVGLFDVALDVGTATNGGGDIEFLFRTVSNGHLLRYEPAAMVRHVHRRDQASLRRQVYNNGRSFPAFLMTIARNEPDKRTSALWFGLRYWLWQWLLKRLINSIIHKDNWTRHFVLAELQGALTAFTAYRQAQKTRLVLERSGANSL